jgi:hypothetical protein
MGSAAFLNHRLHQCFLAWALSISSTFACTCEAPGVRDAKSYADVVFRGTIVALRDSGRPPVGGGDTGKIAVFRVTRVWKGDVGSTFEMPAYEETSACWGFWPRLLRVDNDLLVYAKRWDWDGKTPGTFRFETSICSRTELARDNKDLAELGAGYEPGRSPELLRRRTFLMAAVVVLAVASLTAFILQKRFSSSAPANLLD